MLEKDYKGRVFYQETKGTRLENGMWKVLVEMVEKVLFNDAEEWTTETISVEAVDKSFDSAHKLALRISLAELQSLVYDRGFESLIEGREYQRSLEAEDGTDKNNPPTITQ